VKDDALGAAQKLPPQALPTAIRKTSATKAKASKRQIAGLAQTNQPVAFRLECLKHSR